MTVLSVAVIIVLRSPRARSSPFRRSRVVTVAASRFCSSLTGLAAGAPAPPATQRPVIATC